MNYKDFEKSIRNKLSDYESEVNTDKLIAGIFNPSKETKHRPYWIGYAGVGLFIIFLGVFGSLKFKSGSIDSNDVTLNHPFSSIKMSQDNEDYDKTYMDGNASDENANIPTGSQVNGFDSKIKESSSSLQPNTVYTKDENQPGGVAEISRKGRIQTETVEHQIVSLNKTSNNLHADRASSIPSTRENSLSAGNVADVSGDYGRTTVMKLMPSLSSSVISPAEKSLSGFLPDVKCPTFKQRKRYSFAIVPEVGIFYPLASMEGDVSKNEVLRIRRSNELSLEGLQGALYGKLFQVNGPWYFKAGLNYNRITRRLTFEDSYIKRDTTIGIISITESENHDTITVIKGPIITETTINKYERRHYYHHMLSVPVLIGYQKKFDGFVLGLEAGININLLTDQTGYVLINPNEFGLIHDAALYKRKMGLSYLAGIQMGIPFYNNILALAIRANINPNNFTLTDVNFSEKYQMLGAHLMYEIRF
ncbi:MAG: hypothetical protein J5I59_05205 [Saprospiraceae bacterium]|nr:hypothetical protein [Saprospiraceae bacterium]